MKPFQDRNPVGIGVAGFMLIVLSIGAALQADRLPLISGGDTYYAVFTELGGLAVDDPVLIAGVRVGKVTAVELVNARVRVGFTVDGATVLGSETEAVIKVKTLLGAMFLAVEPSGPGSMEEGDVIPISRTTSPFDVIDAFTGVAERSRAIDTDQLATSLRTLADLSRDTPEEFRSALEGMSGLARTISSRNEEVNSLLSNLERVSGALAERDQDLVALMADADLLFRAILQRRVAVHRLLVATAQLSRRLTGLVRESRADLAPALEHLDAVLDVLDKNEDNLDQALRLYPVFLRYFGTVTGSGPWLDGYVHNLPPVPAGPDD